MYTRFPLRRLFLPATLLTALLLRYESSAAVVVVSKYNYKGDTLYESVEVMPKALHNMDAFLTSHLQYPAAAREKGIGGKVVIGYVIDSAGVVVAAIIAISSGNSSLDEEALRVVWQMPRHSPGLHNGVPVPVYLKLPVTFQIN